MGAGRGILLLCSALAVLLLPGAAVEGLAINSLKTWEGIPAYQQSGKAPRGPSVDARLRILRGSGPENEMPERLRVLRGGVGMGELRETAAKVGNREEESGGDGPEFAAEGGMMKFRLCGEDHEMPVADVDMPLVRGETVTALILASAEGRTAVVEGLLKNGATVTKGNEDGDTPAHMAALNGHVGVLQALLESGGTACLSATNTHGATPLHCAAYRGKEEVACWLLSKGCDSGARDHHDCLPEEMAQAEGHLDLASVLKERRAKSGLQGLEIS